MSVPEVFNKLRAESLIKNFENRNFEGFYCGTKEEALQKALSFLTKEDVVSFSGSATLINIGLLAQLRQNDYKLIDRDTAKSPEETRQMFIDTFCADYFFMSTNAITLDGELVNMDGNSNRVAALCYGPKNVIIIAGMNKIVVNQDAALKRIKSVAAPMNAIRLNCQTPCTFTGYCASCTSPGCICCNLVVTRYARVPKRVKIILVGEELGF